MLGTGAYIIIYELGTPHWHPIVLVYSPSKSEGIISDLGASWDKGLDLDLQQGLKIKTEPTLDHTWPILGPFDISSCPDPKPRKKFMCGGWVQTKNRIGYSSGRSRSLSFEFSGLDLTWLWPFWPSPDLHLTWTWAQQYQQLLFQLNSNFIPVCILNCLIIGVKWFRRNVSVSLWSFGCFLALFLPAQPNWTRVKQG